MCLLRLHIGVSNKTPHELYDINLNKVGLFRFWEVLIPK